MLLYSQNRNDILLIYIVAMSSYLRALLLLLLIIRHSESIMDLQIPSEVVLPDISHQMLTQKVAPLLNITYLSISQDLYKTKYSGRIWGKGSRLLIVMPVKLRYQGCPTDINVIFMVNTGSSKTTLSRHVIDELLQNCQKKQYDKGAYPISIAGNKMYVGESYFKGLNILGSDFLRQVKANIRIQYAGYPEKFLIEFIDEDQIERRFQNPSEEL